jgi:hypothetical protein
LWAESTILVLQNYKFLCKAVQHIYGGTCVIQVNSALYVDRRKLADCVSEHQADVLDLPNWGSPPL